MLHKFWIIFTAAGASLLLLTSLLVIISSTLMKRELSPEDVDNAIVGFLFGIFIIVIGAINLL